MKKLRKRIAATLIALISVFSLCVAAEETVTVKYNGKQLNFDVNPIVENDRVLVPMRNIFETLGCNINYYSYEGKEVVYASKGEKSISLEIGKPEIVVDLREIPLDIAPVIVNDRTLVPLRAVSEALECDVSYDEATNTVNIVKYQGQRNIISNKTQENIYAEDGTLVMTLSAYYPEVENTINDPFYDYVNEYYKTNAENFIKSYKEQNAEDAKIMYEERGENFYPLECSSNFEVTVNRNDWLSITTYDYSNLGGAHPNLFMSSKTFQMLLGKEMTLTDILAMEQEDVDKYVFNKFDEYIKTLEYADELDYKNELEEQKGNVNFYVTNNSVVLYFNRYDILPYVYGAPSVELAFGFESGKKSDVKIDLDCYNADEYTFSLPGNYTTGYTWQTKLSDETVARVESEYIPLNSEIVGAGGKCRFKVTGLKEGEVSLECSYLRTFEENSTIEKYRYRFYVSKDKKITLISQRNITYGEVDNF